MLTPLQVDINWVEEELVLYISGFATCPQLNIPPKNGLTIGNTPMPL